VRTVEVSQIEVLDWQPGDFPQLEVAITCGPGTYIRSIARDLGTVLGTGGTLAALIRTASSGFPLANSLTLDELADQINTHSFQPIPPAAALRHLPQLLLSSQEAKRWCQGQRLTWEDLTHPPIYKADATPYQVYTTDGQFLGIGQASPSETGHLLSPKLVWDAEPNVTV
jgi:tRNA pseudouridine55 synthase